MKKIVTLICTACISISIVGCVSKTTSQDSGNKTTAVTNVAVKDGTEKLKPLEIIGPSTPCDISEFIIECELSQVPEKVEVFEPTNIKDAEGSINYRATNESSYAAEEVLDFKKATQVAKTFLTEKGIEVPDEALNVSITSSVTSLSDGNVDVYVLSVFMPRKVNDIRLNDGDIVVRVAKGYKIVGYRNVQFDLRSKGYYKIISSKEAIDLVPKHTNTIWGEVFTSTGHITSVDLRYFGLTQNNIQPVYVIRGYTDKNKKDQTFSVIIPAIVY